MPSITTRSPEETEALAFALAAHIPAGTVLALNGDLAAGKTCFVRGLARYFAGDEPIHSPTFTLVNEYGTEQKLLHLDLYRLGGPEEVADLGYEELFDSPAVCAIEWADRAEILLPEDCVRILFEHAGADTRRITLHDAAGRLRTGALAGFAG